MKLRVIKQNGIYYPQKRKVSTLKSAQGVVDTGSGWAYFFEEITGKRVSCKTEEEGTNYILKEIEKQKIEVIKEWEV